MNKHIYIYILSASPKSRPPSNGWCPFRALLVTHTHHETIHRSPCTKNVASAGAKGSKLSHWKSISRVPQFCSGLSGFSALDHFRFFLALCVCLLSCLFFSSGGYQFLGLVQRQILGVRVSVFWVWLRIRELGLRRF